VCAVATVAQAIIGLIWHPQGTPMAGTRAYCILGGSDGTSGTLPTVDNLGYRVTEALKMGCTLVGGISYSRDLLTPGYGSQAFLCPAAALGPNREGAPPAGAYATVCNVPG
jgi:hypothetical protein